MAAWCALVRPDVFRSVVMMSGPFAGPPALPFNTADPQAASSDRRRRPDLRGTRETDAAAEALSAVLCDPRSERQHVAAPQGVHAFLRAYYHMKSADWKQNSPFPLKAWTAAGVGQDAPILRDGSRQGDGRDRCVRDAVRRPRSRRASGFPTMNCESIARSTGGPGSRAACRGIGSGGREQYTAELQTFSGRTIDVPSLFIGGKSDWPRGIPAVSSPSRAPTTCSPKGTRRHGRPASSVRGPTRTSSLAGRRARPEDQSSEPPEPEPDSLFFASEPESSFDFEEVDSSDFVPVLSPCFLNPPVSLEIVELIDSRTFFTV